MLWISKIFNEKKPSNGFFSILLSIIISCGGILIAFIPALIQRMYIWSSFSLRMWVGCFLGMIWIALSPLLIDKYINKTNLFFDECEKKCKRKSEIVSLKSHFNNGYFTSKRFIIFSIGWITLLMATLLLDYSYLNKYGIRGCSDIYFYIFILSLIYILYLTSIGLYAIISSLYFVVKIIRSGGLIIDFYSSDIRGQLHYVVEYVFSALKIISTGMLFIPILLDYIEYTNLNVVKLLLYFAIVFYSFSLFVALYVPLREIVKYFNKLKIEELKRLDTIYSKITKKLHYNNKHNIQTQDFLEFHILCQHIECIKTTKILDISWIKKVESFIVIILPIISLFFNQEDIRSLVMMVFSGGN